MQKREFWLPSLAAAVISLTCASGLQAQEIVDEAIALFPSQTDRLEYSNLRELRDLPNYEMLRQHYTGPRLLELEKSLANVGIEGRDVDELVLGWETPSGDLYGLATGEFRTEEIARRATALGFKVHTVEGVDVYCPSAHEDRICIATPDETHGVFGGLEQVSSILRASSTAETLSSNRRLADLVREMELGTPLWGVAERSAVVDWLRFSTPIATGTQIDWKGVFSGVERLAYSVDVDDRVHLRLMLDCGSSAAAGHLQGLFASLRILAQLAWDRKNWNSPNPFGGMELDSSGDRVEVKLETSE